MAMKFMAFFLLTFFSLVLSPAGAADLSLLHGRVVDFGGNPVAGADVYVFDSPDVRRPADFISDRTSANGQYRLKILPGNYWAVAIQREDGRRFGPLSSSDRHSGSPIQIEIESGRDLEMDFTVLDLKEAALRDRKRNENLLRVSGRVLDPDGRPVAMACVLADPRSRPGSVPAYVSGWTDQEGNYLLFLPKGVYYFGASLGFPPPTHYLLKEMWHIERDESGRNLIINLNP